MLNQMRMSALPPEGDPDTNHMFAELAVPHADSKNYKKPVRMKPQLPYKLAATATLGLFFAAASASTAATVIVAESFGGTATGLSDKAADTFASGIASAGGSSTWVAASTFLRNGTVTATGGSSGAYLNLGTYINNAKGTADGKFQLSMSISSTTGAWISLGFTTQNTPSTTKNFTNTGSGGTAYGVATIARRSTTSSPANEIDAFRLDDAGTGQTALDGPDGLTGTRTLTIELDFTADSGYNGTTNFGTARFFDIGNSATPFQTYTYTTDRSFGAIFLSEADTPSGAESGGTISSLTLTQIPEPRAALLGGLGLLALLRRRL